MASIAVSTEWIGRIGANRRFAALLAFVAAGMLAIFLDMLDGEANLADVDDRMRMLQIQDLLADGEWFDRRFPFIAMPEVYVSPWSRLVDLPYFLLTRMLTPLAGQETALQAAAYFWPPLLFVAFAALAVSVTRAVSTRAHPLHYAVAAFLASYTIWEFAPGRVDHHNVQLVLTMAMLAALAARRSTYAALAGLSATISVAVGLECLPYILAASGAVTLMAIAGAADAFLRMQWLGVGVAAGAIPAALLLLGPRASLAAHCDAFSAPWIASLVLGGVAMAALAFAWRHAPAAGRRLRLLTACGVAAIVAGLLATIFPQCLDGPYAMVGETARRFWLERVMQEHPAHRVFAEGQIGILVVQIFYGVVLIAALPRAMQAWRERDAAVLASYLVAVSALALVFIQVRFVRFMPAFAVLFLPWVYREIVVRNPLNRAYRQAALAAPVCYVVLLFILVPQRPAPVDAVDLMTWDQCDGADFSRLDEIPPGRIIAPPGLSFPLAEAAVGHTIASLSFHRAAPGIARVADAFVSRDPALRRRALAPFDYVAVCTREPPFDLSSAPLYAALVDGGDWPGLERLTERSGYGLQLFRIAHDQLN
jgi:hypothetical protein